MKTFGIILIVVGIAMILVRGFTFQSKKEVVDLGSVEINKKENRWVGWPTYTGVVVAAVGIVLTISGNKNRA